MENALLWNQFLKTGAVEDYLSYLHTGFLDRQNEERQNTAWSGMDRQEILNAGFSIGDGNGNQGRAHWRI